MLDLTEHYLTISWREQAAFD